jgi:hypothetical protein
MVRAKSWSSMTKTEMAAWLRDLVVRFDRAHSFMPREFTQEVFEFDEHLTEIERVLGNRIDQIMASKYTNHNDNLKRRSPYVYDDPRFARPDRAAAPAGTGWDRIAARRRSG